MSSEDKWDRFFDANRERKYESVSGVGSSLLATKEIREWIPVIVKRYDIRTVIDCPCGDFNWMKDISGIFDMYIGGDISNKVVDELRNINRKMHFFGQIDIVNDKLPSVDLILTRDCFVHLPISKIKAAIKNIAASGSKFFLTTHYVEQNEHPLFKDMRNMDIGEGQWRPINLSANPFNLGQPLEIIDEKDSSKYGYGKTLSLWSTEQLRQVAE